MPFPQQDLPANLQNFASTLKHTNSIPKGKLFWPTRVHHPTARIVPNSQSFWTPGFTHPPCRHQGRCLVPWWSSLGLCWRCSPLIPSWRYWWLGSTRAGEMFGSPGMAKGEDPKAVVPWWFLFEPNSCTVVSLEHEEGWISKRCDDIQASWS